MSDKYCGGMAFPLAAALPDGLYTVDPGMTLLDYFAAKAIPVAYDICKSRANVNASDIAELAYQTAYAMLRERAK